MQNRPTSPGAAALSPTPDPWLVSIERDAAGLVLGVALTEAARARVRAAHAGAAIILAQPRADLDRALAQATPAGWRWFADAAPGAPISRAWCRVAPDFDEVLAGVAACANAGTLDGVQTPERLREAGTRFWGMRAMRAVDACAQRLAAALAAHLQAEGDGTR